MAENAFRAQGKRRIAEIWIDEDGNPQMRIPKNINLRELEFAMGNLFFLSMEMRIKNELKAGNKTQIFNPFTGQPFLNDLNEN